MAEGAGVGITPACAGKRRPNNGKWRYKRDHPRMCGEKTERPSVGKKILGSPPHVRGKDPVLHLRQCLQVRPDHARYLVHLSFLRA